MPPSAGARSTTVHYFPGFQGVYCDSTEGMKEDDEVMSVRRIEGRPTVWVSHPHPPIYPVGRCPGQTQALVRLFWEGPYLFHARAG